MMNTESRQFERLASRFADGELEAVEQLEALKRMRSDAAFAAAVEHQVQLRASVGRVMSTSDEASLKAPESLRASITAMAPAMDSTSETSSTPANQADDEAPAVVARIGAMRWLPTALAAILLLGAMSFFFGGFGNLTTSSPNPPGRILTVAQINAFSQRHETCANNPAVLYGAEDLPRDLERLPNQIAQRFHASAVPALDLSPLGYTFAEIGTCSIPGRSAVHLVYTTDLDAEHSDRVSLWIVEDQGQLNIEPGVIYTEDSLGKHPVLIWRQGGMIYYLTGDQPKQTEEAARLIAQEI